MIVQIGKVDDPFLPGRDQRHFKFVNGGAHPNVRQIRNFEKNFACHEGLSFGGILHEGMPRERRAEQQFRAWLSALLEGGLRIGYKTEPMTNAFEFDTSIRGNSNRGHEFRKDFDKNKEIKGVIGPALSADDRKALIEYLKTL